MVHSEIKTIKTDTFEIDCFHFGSGKRTFVIIPGIGVNSVMLSADAIAEGFAAFTERYTVYVFDQEKNIDDSYSVPSTACHIAEAMKQIGLKNADIFGASQGGMIGQYLAIHFPELVHALYLGCTLSRQNEVSNVVFPRWMELAKGDDAAAMNHDISTTIYSKEYYAKYAAIFAEMEKTATREQMDRFYWLSKSVHDFDCYADLEKIQCPVFVTGSFQDHVLSGMASVEIAVKLGCDLHIYQGYGHAVYDEDPDYRPRMLQCLSELD